LRVTQKATLLLASNSPRRRQLLGLGNWEFITAVSDVDETQQDGESPKEYVWRLARAKALAAIGEAPDEDVVLIGSDTAVVDGDSILGKPADSGDAVRMLNQLRGHTHQVYTGVALHRIRDGKTLIEMCVTDVPMRNYSDEEISAYVQTGDPLDKAGAYAIQHPDFQPVESMRGCYASVMGLPMCHVTRALQEMDVPPLANVSTACRKLLSYECPVSGAILRGEM
jgi:septum formation protein